MKRISIVMAYFNRKSLLIETLRSISKIRYKNLEVIIVDDASADYERVEDLQEQFKFIKVIRIEPSEKNYQNSCMPYNKGIAEASGEIIILQNPECSYIGDVLHYANTNLNDTNLLSFSCYALDPTQTKLLSYRTYPEYYLKSLPQQIWNDIIGWYNHSVYRPVGYHFCSAILKSNLDKLGGFDERYAPGYAYEDDEFLVRVKRLGLSVEIIDSVSVFHQFHQKEYTIAKSHLVRQNKELFFEKTQKESTILVTNSYKK